MNVEKISYFYSKLEVKTDVEFKDGCREWYMDYFNADAHVLDSQGNDIIAKKGTVYLVPPDTRIYFKYDNVESFIHTCLIFKSNREYIDELDIPYMTPIKIQKVGEFEQLLFEMQERQVTLSKFSQRAQNLYIELILLFIHDEIHNYTKDYSVQRGDDLQVLRNTMMNSLAFHWTLKNMAERVNMSVSTFQRKYKSLYGKTPIADLYDMRFTRSKRLLDTGFSIPWILKSCCFKSFQHFSRFFKEREGMSPSEYRDRNKKD